MESQTFYQISLIAAFIAGMVALFAPCCITYLLPAYLGNIFKERKRVLFMTLVYSLGIFVVMLPVVLGARAITGLFFKLHDATYIIGGVFMIFIAFFSLLGIKLPMPHLRQQNTQGAPDVTSTFTLGIFSGITSACCAPVLVGVVTLSALSPTVFQSLGVGVSYVLGMVTPLYVASIFIHKRNLLEKPILTKQISTVHLVGKTYPVMVSNIIAAAIFAFTGVIMIVLTSLGMIGMPTAESSITKSINSVAFGVTEMTNGVSGLNFLFSIVGLYLLYRFVRYILRTESDN